MVHVITACVRILILKNASLLRKSVPDRLSSSVIRVSSLYLICAACHAPDKFVIKQILNLNYIFTSSQRQSQLLQIFIYLFFHKILF